MGKNGYIAADNGDTLESKATMSKTCPQSDVLSCNAQQNGFKILRGSHPRTKRPRHLLATPGVGTQTQRKDASVWSLCRFSH